jgi:hypothetical protein
MRSRKSLFLALAIVLVAVPAFAGGVMANFPKAGEYTIHSHPSFLINVGDAKEVVECNATLVLRAGDPYTTPQGTRRVDLTILNWKADGDSKLLGGPLHFRMEQGVKSPDQSYVETYGVAKTGSNEFPAKAQFSVPYEVETPFGTVSNLSGVTRGTIKSFPPHGDTFLMQKGDIANVLAELMPAQLSSISAAGEVRKARVKITPLACVDPE